MIDLGDVGAAVRPLVLGHALATPFTTWPDASIRVTPPTSDSGGGGGEGVYVPQGSMTFG